MATAVADLNDESFETNVSKAAGPLVVSFVAAWSSPARALALMLDDLSQRLGSSVGLAVLDVDESPATARALRIRALPTVALFVAGTEKVRTDKVMTLDECAAWIAEQS